jgi:zinc protease
MPRSLPAALTLALLLAASVYAQVASPTPLPKLAIEHYQLPNGLQVVLCPSPKIPLAHLNLRFRVGSKHERPGRTGFAHLFEHLMFDISDPSSSFETQAEQLGATGVNAFTHADYTEYMETIPSSRLERMLWLESNRISTLPQTLTQAKFEKEREVVRNEFREKIENQPYNRINLPLYQYSFPPGHPYAHHPIGSHEDLLAASLDDVRAFYREYYNPDNLSLVLVGDFDPAQAKPWIAKYFGSLAPGPNGLIGPVQSAPQLSAPKLVEIREHAPTERIFIAWPTPGIYTPDDVALEVAAFVFTDDPSPWNEILTKPAGTGRGINQQQLQDASLFFAVADPASGSTVADVEKVLAAGIARFAREGPSEEELTRARNNLEFGQIGKLEDLYDLGMVLNDVQQFYGGVEHFEEWIGRYRRVTAEAVRSAVGHWLSTPNRLTIHVMPDTARQESTALDRTQPPPFQAEKPFRAPDIKSAKLANGLQILVVERHDLPKIAVELRFRLGAERSPAGKAGLATLAMATAGRGTSNRTEDEIKKECSLLAISLHAGNNVISQSGGFEALRNNLDPAMQLLADMVRHPEFPKDALESQKTDFIDEFEKAEGRIDNFWPSVTAIAFGKTHPFGNVIGTAETYKSITREDAQEFQHRYWKPDVAVLVFAGDITLEDAVAIAAKNFGDWQGTAGPPPPMSAPTPMTGRIFLIDRPGATQTKVVQVLRGVSRVDPDYASLLLVDRVWGGLFSSRLNQNIRRDKGIAYGVESELNCWPGYGLWVTHSTVELSRTRDALVAFGNELRGIAGEKPITEQELETVKENVIRSYPSSFEGAWGVVQNISMSWAWGLPTTDHQTFPQKIAEVTLAQAQAIAKKYALPDQSFFLLIGDRQKIEPQLSGLGVGAITLLP